MSTGVFEGLLATAEVSALFEASALVQAMLDFEAALVRAQAAEGMVPSMAAQAIAGVCKAELFDLPALLAAGARAGSLAIPLVGRLTETVALYDAEAAAYVHWGSTSQDVVDTAQALVMRRALALIDRDLGLLIAALLHQARAHEAAPMLARTLLQPAQVISWGFKLLGWIAPLLRCQQQLRALGQRALQLQLGGAVGSRSVLGPRAEAIAQRVAQALQLALPAGAWFTQRDELMRLFAELGILCGALGKIGRDLSLLAQGEVGEVAEPVRAGRGGSSAMPHKRNPVAALVALSAALRAPHRVAALLSAMPQEHERGLGNWQAELAETAGLFVCTQGAVAALAEAMAGLQVDPARMLHNIAAQRGLVFAEGAAMALAVHIGKARAHVLLEQLCAQVQATGRPLSDLFHAELLGDAALRAELGAGFAPAQLGAQVDQLFSAERAAESAIRCAEPQLAALAERAQEQALHSPWSAWL